MAKDKDGWDLRYEWTALPLLLLGFGLVGLDRFAINPLFPAMAKDLRLNYQDLGDLAAALAVAWGLASAWMGAVSDRLGRRKVLIGSLLVFSAMSGASGLTTGLASLIAARALMGVSEGAFVPASIAATIEASKPTRRGFNFGLQQNGLPLIGLGVGPILVTQLLQATGSWRAAFWIVAIPGLIVAGLMALVIRDTQGTVGTDEPATPRENGARWRDALRVPNVALACLVLVFMAGSLNVIIAMTPSYLVRQLKIDTAHMGFIMSATGLGALVVGVAMPTLSDYVGRKPVMLLCALCSALALWGFMSSPADPVRLFLFLGAMSGCAFSVIFINNGPLTMESAPAALASTSVGLVVGIGEVFGGGIAPAAAGFVADHYGIQNVFKVSLACLVAGLVIILFVREPARRARRTSEAAEAA